MKTPASHEASKRLKRVKDEILIRAELCNVISSLGIDFWYLNL